MRPISQVFRTVVAQVPVDMQYLTAARAGTVEGSCNKRVYFPIICFPKRYLQVAPGSCCALLQHPSRIEDPAFCFSSPAFDISVQTPYSPQAACLIQSLISWDILPDFIRKEQGRSPCSRSGVKTGSLHRRPARRSRPRPGCGRPAACRPPASEDCSGRRRCPCCRCC